MRTHEISNSDDVIDSRDVIARIEELEAMTDECSECDGSGQVQPQPEPENPEPETEDCPSCNGAGEVSTADDEDIEELKALKALTDEAEGYSDWRYGAALIRDSYFRDYAKQFADDIGAIDSNASWPLTYIDWDAAADALKQDYTSVDFDGETYWVR